jgi:hypothetical protein
MFIGRGSNLQYSSEKLLIYGSPKRISRDQMGLCIAVSRGYPE